MIAKILNLKGYHNLRAKLDTFLALFVLAKILLMMVTVFVFPADKDTFRQNQFQTLPADTLANVPVRSHGMERKA